jgi:hypothetical protein
MENNGTSVNTDFHYDANAEAYAEPYTDAYNGIDIGVNTDDVVCSDIECDVVDNALLMENNELTRHIWLLERKVMYYKNWLLKIDKVCEYCGTRCYPEDIWACTECCKFICDECLDDTSKEHEEHGKLIECRDIGDYCVTDTDDDSDENTDSEDDDENSQDE